jgi:hypothetical protein
MLNHERIVRFLKSEPAALLTTWPVIIEVGFFLDTAGIKYQPDRYFLLSR